MTHPHPQPRVVQHLRNGGTLEQLTERFAIKVTRSARNPNLVLLKYNQIESPMGEAIVQECRGIILDESQDFAVVSRSFDKFFNHGEGHAPAIDWQTARVLEKLDGSLMVLYHHDGDWRVQSSGTPDASGGVGPEKIVLANLFWETFRNAGYVLPPATDASLCFAFELMSRHNQIVVRHEDARLCLIGVRDRETQVERDVSDCTHYGYDVVKSFALQSFGDISHSFLSMQPLHQEGYVIVDRDFHRVKVKHPGYVALHQMKDEFSTRRMVEVVRSGETSEVLTYFPEWANDLERVRTRFDPLLVELDADYERIRHHTVQKDFALEAIKTRCSGALFALRSGKVTSVRQYMADVNVDTLMKILDLRDDTVTKT
jgi:hypothetical protein